MRQRLRKIFSLSCIFAVLFVVVACSQSRTGIGKKKKADEIWQAQQACQIMEGSELLGCFSIEPNISKNQATIEVLDMGFNPLEVPYRVLARRPEDVAFTLLAEGMMADIGQQFVVKAKSQHFIEAYEEWRFETEKTIASDGVGFMDASAGRGIPIAQVRIFWPELLEPAPK